MQVNLKPELFKFRVEDHDDGFSKDPSSATVYVTVDESIKIGEEEFIHPDNIGGHIPEVESVVILVGGSGCEEMECVFTIDRKDRTNDEIVEEIKTHGWTHDNNILQGE
jgi:hypothetical protein